MKIKNKAQCGSLESSDLMVFVEPADSLKIEIESSVKKQYGKSIERTVKEELERAGVKSVYIKIQDAGALDPTIRARVSTALKRGSK